MLFVYSLLSKAESIDAHDVCGWALVLKKG